MRRCRASRATVAGSPVCALSLPWASSGRLWAQRGARHAKHYPNPPVRVVRSSFTTACTPRGAAECNRLGGRAHGAPQGLAQVVVAGENRFMDLFQHLAELFCHVHRAVLAASATDGDRQVATLCLAVLRNPALDESVDVIAQFRDDFLRFQEFDDLLVEPVQAAQADRPVRVGQASQVESRRPPECRS